MTTENTNLNPEATPQDDPNAKGLPPGVTPADTGEGNRGEGAPKAPVINNAPPPKEPTPEEKAKIAESEAAEKAAKEKEEKEAADKKAADEAEQKKKDDAENEALTEYPDYGDANANAVVSILKEANIPVKEAHDLFKEAVETGDFTKINMATLTEKLGKAKADLVLLGVQSYYNTFTANTKETVSAVYEAVGGEANYAKVQAWARAKGAKDPAFAAQVEGFNQMFDLNKTAAIMAARELVALYEKDGGNSSLTKKQVHGDQASTTSQSQNGYISKADYNEQIKAAHEKGDTHEITRLRNLRLASLKQ